MPEKTVYYNIEYKEKNFFGYREWIYVPYIKGLIALTGLKRRSTILDVACGQGFFSYLFHKCSMRVYGIDTSEVGIRAAQSAYGSLGIKFVVGDAQAIPFSEKFDCVFTRSCSLYNTDDFPVRFQVTDRILHHVKEGGAFIFAYNTNFSHSKKSESWRYHTLSHVKQHFYRYPNAKIFFTCRLDALLMREYAFNLLFTKLNMFLSKVLGLGGDLVCIVKKDEDFVKH